MRSSLLALSALMLLSGLAVAKRLPDAAADSVVAGEVLVRFKPGAAARSLVDAVPAGDGLAARTLKSTMGLVRGELLLSGQIERLRLPGYMDVERAVALLQADPAVLWAEPNFRRRKSEVIPNDPRFAEQWALKNTGQSGADGSGYSGADLATTYANDANGDGVADRADSSSVLLAIVDDGFELNHPDLAGNFNTVLGRDFMSDGSEDADPSPVIANDSHGTLVAGAAGAVGNNGVGIAAPAWKAQLLPIRFAFDSATTVKAFDYARMHGAKVVNASFGGPQFSNTERDAIQALNDADVLLVAAAGNLDSNTDFAKAAYPANYDVPNVVAVGAINRRKEIAGFTQYGAVSVDVMAPGVLVLTTSVGAGYSTVSGTSFSAPYTAAVAALIRATYPDADVGEVKARLIEGSSGISDGRLFAAGGAVDANSSLRVVPRPSLVIDSVRFDDTATGDGDGALDPGERLIAEIAVKNLWMPASGVKAQISSSNTSITVGSDVVATPAIGKGETVVMRFPLTMASNANDHQILDFALRLTADGYSTTRYFSSEQGLLRPGIVSAATLSSGPRDEFHTWQLDLPASSDPNRRLVITSLASRDIDILVKQGSPVQYEISLDVDPETDRQTFFADIPREQIGGGADGNETVTINNPAAGAWFVTVINYTQTADQPYRLSFDTPSTTVTPAVPQPSTPASGGGSGGGGAFLACVPMLFGFAWRWRHAPTRGSR